MKLKNIFTCLILASCLAWADQVTLKNGDKITGSIVKKDGGNLVLKSAAAGPITIPWDQVVAITSDGPLNVVTGGKTVQSTLSMTGGRVMVGGSAVALADVTAIRDADEQKAFDRLVHPGLGELWAGNAALNLGGTTGNSETSTLVVNVNAARVTRTDKITIYFNAVKSSADIDGVSNNTAEAVRGGWGYSRNLVPKLFVNVFNDYEFDKFQDLDLRYVFGGGAGYHLWKSPKGFFDVLAGVDYNHSAYGAELTNTPPLKAYDTSFAELYYGEDFAYKFNARTSLTESGRVFNDVSSFSAYRVNFDAAANTQLTKWLTWNVSLSDHYLAVPPAGKKDNDFVYSTGIGVVFAR